MYFADMLLSVSLFVSVHNTAPKLPSEVGSARELNLTYLLTPCPSFSRLDIDSNTNTRWASAFSDNGFIATSRCSSTRKHQTHHECLSRWNTQTSECTRHNTHNWRYATWKNQSRLNGALVASNSTVQAQQMALHTGWAKNGANLFYGL